MGGNIEGAKIGSLKLSDVSPPDKGGEKVPPTYGVPESTSEFKGKRLIGAPLCSREEKRLRNRAENWLGPETFL